MHRKRRGSRGDVLIDLTSLLDVIFILLLIVMWGQNNVDMNLRQTQAETEKVKAQAEAEQKLYEQQTEIAENVNKYVCAVSVVVPYDKEDVTRRKVQILKEGEEIESFDLIGQNVNDSVEAFKESLVKYIESNGDKPVILSLNEKDENILYRDELMVTELFAELTRKYNNVYIRGSVSGEEK